MEPTITVNREWYERVESTYRAQKMALANPRSRLALADKVVEAGEKLRDKMAVVHKESEYVWHLAYSHGCEYKGPHYRQELDDLSFTLAAYRAGETGGKG